MQHPNHPGHDLTLIAGLAAGDLDGSERARAQALIDTCAECAAVHHDILAIAAATRALPNLARAPRDFRLTAEQAARLRRGSWVQRVLAPFGAARSATKPIAAALTSLGIAGLLFASFAPGLMGSSGSATGNERDQAAIGAGPTSAPAAAPGATTAALTPELGAGQPGPYGSRAPDDAYGVKAGESARTSEAPLIAVAGSSTSGSATSAPLSGHDSTADLDVVTTQNPLVIGSLALLAVGLLLFGLRFAGRRLR